MLSRIQRIPDQDRELFLDIQKVVLGVSQDTLERLRNRVAKDEENGISSALVCEALSQVFDVTAVHGHILMEAPCSWVITASGLIIVPIQPLFPLVGPIDIMKDSFFVKQFYFFHEDHQQASYIGLLGIEFKNAVSTLAQEMRSLLNKK